jgi:hypothetical protein
MGRLGKWLAAGICLSLTAWSGDRVAASPAAGIGIFTEGVDVGTPSTLGKGSSSFDAARNVYTVSGGGENMWATADHFHYLWKKVSGDVAIEATVKFVATQPAGTPPVDHRKACLVIRQSLDAAPSTPTRPRTGAG